MCNVSLARFRAGFFAGATVLSIVGCDGATGPSGNPLPVLTQASPTRLVAGEAPSSVTLSGTGFVRNSQVRWNGSDRPTHFRSETSLTFDLLADDLATVGTAQVVVVNGEPGGGTSGALNIAIVNPVPTITGISPASLPAPPGFSESVRITITGTGFAPDASVMMSSQTLWKESGTATSIVVNVPGGNFGSPGVRSFTVVNPAPGGGTSNAVTFAVDHPVPAIVSLGPDSAFVGMPFQLTVHGSGFDEASVVRWNGADRPTAHISSTVLYAQIPESDLTAPTTASVIVFNPTPGGGSSNALPMRVTERAPSITGVDPGVIAAGAPPTTVTLTGSHFHPSATAQWDGEDRPATVLSSNSITVTLSAADLAAPRVGMITVTNPAPSGRSDAMAVAVVAAAPSLAVARTVVLPHVDIAWDDQRDVLYASVPGDAAQYANTIVRIDPATGDVTGSVAVGSDPAHLEITEDAQFLYVALRGAPKVVRVALGTFTRDIDLELPADGFLGSRFAEDIVAIPGAPHRVAIATFYRGVSPRNAGTFLFDDAVQRPATGPSHTGSNRITRGPSANRIYGYNDESTEYGFRSLAVSDEGLREETVSGALVSGFGTDIEYGGGYVYATSGAVVDVASMSLVGTLPTSGIVRPDAASARVHVLSDGVIRTYHYRAYTSIGSFQEASLTGQSRMVRWGTDGLAVGGGASIVFLRGGLVAP